MARFLLVEARFYQDISDALFAGASAILQQNKIDYDRLEVPGAFEIPAAIQFAAQKKHPKEDRFLYDGFVALGCVIRGETSHYDYVAGECMRGLQTLSWQYGLPIGSGVLTVENAEQAWARADQNKKNLGGAAANAAIAMWKIKTKMENETNNG